MGNAAMTTIFDEEDQKREQVVTVMKRDGTSMEFCKQLCVAKLLKDFPGHFVCKSEELGSWRKAKILSPKTRLRRGKTYFVLPLQKTCRRSGNKLSQINPIAQQSKSASQGDFESIGSDSRNGGNSSGERIKLVMTKQQLAKMLADGSILISAGQALEEFSVLTARVNLGARPGLSFSSMNLFNHPVRNTSVGVRRNWSPVLDSIVEVPSQ